jgi:hypothetical protein
MVRSGGPRGALLLLGVLALGACSTYTPVRTPAVGTTVRVRVPLKSALDDPNAARETVSVEGRVLRMANDTITLATETRRELGAYRELVQFDTLRLSTGSLSSIELKEFSKQRSIALGAAITGTVTVLAIAALGIKGGKAGNGPPGDGSEGAIVLNPIIGTIWRLLGNHR